MSYFKGLSSKVDWATTLIPFAIVLVLMIVFMLIPDQSTFFVDTIRGFLGDTCGLYYSIFGVGTLILTLYIGVLST